MLREETRCRDDDFLRLILVDLCLLCMLMNCINNAAGPATRRQALLVGSQAVTVSGCLWNLQTGTGLVVGPEGARARKVCFCCNERDGDAVDLSVSVQGALF